MTLKRMRILSAVVTAANRTNFLTATTVVTIEQALFFIYLPVILRADANGQTAAPAPAV